MASIEQKAVEHVSAEDDPISKSHEVTTNDLQLKDEEDAESWKQDGVEQQEAITKVWTKKALYITFILSVS